MAVSTSPRKAILANSRFVRPSNWMVYLSWVDLVWCNVVSTYAALLSQLRALVLSAALSDLVCSLALVVSGCGFA
ncbi:hypothetical protein EON64_05620 [archaeon]|nr:MAG: hypothetical protein EON64_05620 [archaeon]